MRPMLLVTLVVQCSLSAGLLWLSRCLLMWALVLPWTHARISRKPNLKNNLLAAIRLLPPITSIAVLSSGVSGALLRLNYAGMTLPAGHMTMMLVWAWTQFGHQVGGKSSGVPNSHSNSKQALLFTSGIVTLAMVVHSCKVLKWPLACMVIR